MTVIGFVIAHDSHVLYDSRWFHNCTCCQFAGNPTAAHPARSYDCFHPHIWPCKTTVQTLWVLAITHVLLLIFVRFRGSGGCLTHAVSVCFLVFEIISLSAPTAQAVLVQTRLSNGCFCVWCTPVWSASIMRQHTLYIVGCIAVLLICSWQFQFLPCFFM